MSLHAFRTVSRQLCAELYRHVASISRAQSSISIAPRRFKSKTTKSTEIEEEPILPPSSAVRRTPTVHIVKAIKQGDTYIAGEAYYSFTPYTFYEVEDKLVAHRQSQINSSEKMKIFCMNKLAIADDEPPPRRLLPEEYGYLVEWPGKDNNKVKKKYKPMYSIMEKKYGLTYDPRTGEICRDRIPL